MTCGYRRTSCGSPATACCVGSLFATGSTSQWSLTAAGAVRLLMSPEGHEALAEEIGTWRGRSMSGDGRTHRIEFGHLDYRVYVKLDGAEVLATDDLQYAPDIEALRQTHRIAPVRVSMSARDFVADLHHLRVDRDVYYTYSEAKTLRAYARKPFALGRAEYFVLGDNSPASADGREWFTVGLHLREDLRSDRYQVGTVRADQIVGQAFFVYLPGLLHVEGPVDLRVPDLGRTRFVR